jgi:hypothetical protein
MSSFGKGFGILLGMAAAVICVVLVLNVAGHVVEPCPTCHGTGKCGLCGGTGKGIVFGDCMVCDGKKSCQNCGGVGWKTR